MIPLALSRLPWRYIGLALAVIGALWFAFDAGRDNMRAKLRPRIDLLTRERDAAQANVAALKTALQGQSAAIDKAGAATKAAQDKAAGAARKAQERAPGLERVKVRLEAVQASGGRCDVPDAVADAWSAIR